MGGFVQFGGNPFIQAQTHFGQLNISVDFGEFNFYVAKSLHCSGLLLKLV